MPESNRRDAGDIRNSTNQTVDYQETLQMFRMLADIRFKLLAIVPTLAAAAVAFLPDQPTETRIGAGVVGFLATVGVVIYDQRNSQFYNNAISRASRLEKLLMLQAFDEANFTGGVATERTNEVRSLFFVTPGKAKRTKDPDENPSFIRASSRLVRGYGVEMNHDRGLGLVYATALAAWAYLLTSAIVDLIVEIHRFGFSRSLEGQGESVTHDFWSVAFGLAAVVGLYMIYQFEILNRRKK